MKDLFKVFDEIKQNNPEVNYEYELLKVRNSFIEELINYRKEMGLTQGEFADRINVKQQMISRFEMGDVDPRLSFIGKILKGMNKELLFVRKDYKRVEELGEYKQKEKKLVALNGMKYKGNEYRTDLCKVV